MSATCRCGSGALALCRPHGATEWMCHRCCDQWGHPRAEDLGACPECHSKRGHKMDCSRARKESKQ